jgi:hypothetical protein
MDHRSWNGIRRTIDETDKMTEFRVMPPIEALAAPGEQIGNRISP